MEKAVRQEFPVMEHLVSLLGTKFKLAFCKSFDYGRLVADIAIKITSATSESPINREFLLFSGNSGNSFLQQNELILKLFHHKVHISSFTILPYFKVIII